MFDGAQQLIAGLLSGGLLTALVAWRKTTGSAEKLARDELWKELGRVREQVGKLESEVARLRETNLQLISDKNSLQITNNMLVSRVRDLENTVKELESDGHASSN